VSTRTLRPSATLSTSGVTSVGAASASAATSQSYSPPTSHSSASDSSYINVAAGNGVSASASLDLGGLSANTGTSVDVSFEYSLTGHIGGPDGSAQISCELFLAGVSKGSSILVVDSGAGATGWVTHTYSGSYTAADLAAVRVDAIIEGDVTLARIYNVQAEITLNDFDMTPSGAGSVPLVRAVVYPFLRENLHARESVVRIDGPGGGGRKVWTGSRLRMWHLLAMDSTDARDFRAGTRDILGTWSEWSGPDQYTFSAFSGGNNPRSIGSLQNEDALIEESATVFPDLSVGTGIVQVHRTLVSEQAFEDEQRRAQQLDPRAAFTVTIVDVDDTQVAVLQRFVRSVNSIKPFFFYFTDPQTGDEKKYPVRFRDTSFAEALGRATYSDVQFNLIEMVQFGYGDV
jgi:hypothetical protein